MNEIFGTTGPAKPKVVEGTGTGVGLKDDTDEKYDVPKMWKIIIINDDYTPFEFVEYLLRVVFNISFDVAKAITFDVHKKGKGVVGTYTKEVAETLLAKANAIIQSSDHPLQLTMEPAE